MTTTPQPEPYPSLMPDSKLIVQAAGWLVSLVLGIQLWLRPAQDAALNIHPLEAANDSLRQVNVTLQHHLDSLSLLDAQLQQQLNEQTQSLTQLKQQQHEAMDRVRTLPSTDLIDFFSTYQPRSPRAADPHHPN